MMYNRDENSRHNGLFQHLRTHIGAPRRLHITISPITSMFGIHNQDKNHILPEDGLANYLNNLLLPDYYIKLWSQEHSMVKLLTRSL